MNLNGQNYLNMAEYTTESLFNFLKSLGKLKEYASYEDYQRRVYSIGQTESEQSASYKEWYSTLEGKDKADFDKCFGDDTCG